MLYYASVSGGKDSVAMVHKILEYKLPLDGVIFYDTGMEFTAIYDTINRLEIYLESINIPLIRLKCPYDFMWKMLEYPFIKKDGSKQNGYWWCGAQIRWGTGDKRKIINDYCGINKQYVGIAADEINRIEKNLNEGKLLPLIDLNMTEQDCLKYCYELGYEWLEDGVDDNGDPVKVKLYEILDRVSCWCCASKNRKELKNIYKYLPQYWSKLLELQNKIGAMPMKPKYMIMGRPYGNVNDMDRVFRIETKRE